LFFKNDFIKKNRQYEIFSPYLKDRPSEEWANLTLEIQKGGTKKQKVKFKLTRKIRRRNKNKTNKTI
jgi:hypothetical protein